jgi:hypothetical protein
MRLWLRPKTTNVSFATVWRIVERAGIELTAGREAKGYKRPSPERRVAIIEARRANPTAPQRRGWRQPLDRVADRTRVAWQLSGRLSVTRSSKSQTWEDPSVDIIETVAAFGACLLVLAVAVVRDRRPYHPGK